MQKPDYIYIVIYTGFARLLMQVYNLQCKMLIFTRYAEAYIYIGIWAWEAIHVLEEYCSTALYECDDDNDEEEDSCIEPKA